MRDRRGGLAGLCARTHLARQCGRLWGCEVGEGGRSISSTSLQALRARRGQARALPDQRSRRANDPVSRAGARRRVSAALRQSRGHHPRPRDGAVCRTKIIPIRRIFSAPSDETLRGAGLSRQKIAALKDISQKRIEGVIPEARKLSKLERRRDHRAPDGRRAASGAGRSRCISCSRSAGPTCCRSTISACAKARRNSTAAASRRKNSPRTANAGRRSAAPPPGTSGAIADTLTPDRSPKKKAAQKKAKKKVARSAKNKKAKKAGLKLRNAKSGDSQFAAIRIRRRTRDFAGVAGKGRRSAAVMAQTCAMRLSPPRRARISESAASSTLSLSVEMKRLSPRAAAVRGTGNSCGTREQ